MPKNIEIKAKLQSPSDLHSLARKLSGSDGTIINQEDTFFKVSSGKLKLRKILGRQDELIFYTRSNQKGPKLSTFKKVGIGPQSDSSDDLMSLLSEALGVKGQVIKWRTLYMVGQTRIHVDEVEGLGNFVELEVKLEDSQTAEEGEAIAKDLAVKLKIPDEDLLDRAYVDLLLSDS